MSRPTPDVDRGIYEALRAIDTPTISNAIEAFEVRDRTDGYASAEIRCEYPELGPLVGHAVTCTVDTTTGGPRRPSLLGELLDLLEVAPRPAVIVCQYVGSDRRRGCFAGDMAATVFQRLGAVGLVTDAPNRDLQAIQTRAPGFHVFGVGAVASHGNGAIVDVDIPVVVGGLRVRPNDLIHADMNGVISVPLSIAHLVVAEATRILDAERALHRLVTDPSSSFLEIRQAFAH